MFGTQKVLADVSAPVLMHLVVINYGKIVPVLKNHAMTFFFPFTA
jgi:hypothetical protein